MPGLIKERFAQRHWYHFSAVSALLYPLSLLYRLLIWIRRNLYRCGILRSVAMPVPVIVIGNLTVGGTGKTPLVIWLSQALRNLGFRPGVIAGGYGGTGRRNPSEVRPGDDPRIFGDEAVLLAMRCGVPVWSGADRAIAAERLLHAHPDCNLLICDDGLQHYRIRRDLEIAVQDHRRFGNGCLMPAGPLREPSGRRVDACVLNGVDAPGDSNFLMRLLPGNPYRLDNPAIALDLKEMRGREVHAVAGIGDPDRFFASLRLLGMHVIEHAFADHHDFVEKDLDFEGDGIVLMTEKDAVKCRRFLRQDLFALPVDAQLDDGFMQFLEKRLHGFKAS